MLLLYALEALVDSQYSLNGHVLFIHLIVCVYEYGIGLAAAEIIHLKISSNGFNFSSLSCILCGNLFSLLFSINQRSDGSRVFSECIDIHKKWNCIAWICINNAFTYQALWEKKRHEWRIVSVSHLLELLLQLNGWTVFFLLEKWIIDKSLAVYFIFTCALFSPFYLF